MSWLSKATGIHWGNIAAPIGAVVGSIIPGVGTALGGALGKAVGSIGNAVGGGKPGGGGSAPAAGGASSGSSVGNIFANPDGSIDWMKLADMGLTGLDAYNAAMNAQKQGSLLNTGVSNYNNNWTQGKNILLKPHPVDLSADFAGSDNPFARLSAGAVPGSATPPPVPKGSLTGAPTTSPTSTLGAVPSGLYEQIFKKKPPTGSKIVGSVPQPVKPLSPTSAPV